MAKITQVATLSLYADETGSVVTLYPGDTRNLNGAPPEEVYGTSGDENEEDDLCLEAIAEGQKLGYNFFYLDEDQMDFSLFVKKSVVLINALQEGEANAKV
jgi:hypothetical protein